MDVNDPLNEEGARGVFYLCWCLHVFQISGVDLQTGFFTFHVQVNICSKFRGQLWVSDIKSVTKVHLLAHFLAEGDQTLLENLAYTLSLLFFCLSGHSDFGDEVLTQDVLSVRLLGASLTVRGIGRLDGDFGALEQIDFLLRVFD